MTRSILRLVAALVAACVVLALHAPARAATTESDPLVTAVQRDLNLTQEQATARLGTAAKAHRLEERFSRELGRAYAGTWLGPDHSVVVGTTDQAQAQPIQAAGAVPEVVAHSVGKLAAVKRQLDEAPLPDAEEVASWYVDLPNNRVVVAALPGGRTAATTFVTTSGAGNGLVEVIATRQAPRLLYDVRGGDAYYPGGFRCSVGFSVEGGFVTVGHCGAAGTSVDGYNFVEMGVVEEAAFPGDDHAWVSVNSNWTPRPWVNDYSGGNVAVTGSQEAGVGAGTCRSGSTTGWQCGYILAKDVTVNYPQGAVYGLTQTSACAEAGDSGGSYLWGSQAQGVLSGGTGNCTSGGQTFFQPVNEILDTYDLTLATG